jgi:hypothetical protein
MLGGAELAGGCGFDGLLDFQRLDALTSVVDGSLHPAGVGQGCDRPPLLLHALTDKKAEMGHSLFFAGI